MISSATVDLYLQDIARVQHGNLAHKLGRELVNHALLLVVAMLFQLFAQYLHRSEFLHSCSSEQHQPKWNSGAHPFNGHEVIKTEDSTKTLS